MGSELGITGDTKPAFRVGPVGVWWCVFTAVWTVTLLGGMAFLWVRREMPILRVRGLPISFAAIVLMHLYWIAVQLGYLYGALMPEVAEFWIMSIWFPFGIALFHASNSRFLHVSDAQKKYLRSSHNLTKPVAKDLLSRWRRLDHSTQTMVLVSIGMGGQFFLSLFMFLVSRKFHNSFGIPGTGVSGTYMEIKTKQGRGWEWWPSVFWQMCWAWIYAPFILWRSRNIRDTQGWRFQTIACCVSNLHAAPMWLIALYVPAMEAVNNVFIPPQWIAVSIMLLEIFTVFVPIVEVCKHKALTQETLESIARWESRKRALGLSANKSVHTQSSNSTWMKGRMGRASSVHTSHSSSGGSILTMDALEYTLARNPEPLQHFSALKDFSGENIAFLTRVREWKATWFPHLIENREQLHRETGKTAAEPTVRKELPIECFEVALRIYIDFISATEAEFQINLSSGDFKQLQATFEASAIVLCGQERSSPDPVTPFDEPLRTASGDSAITLTNLRYTGEVPDDFNEAVFDDAEMHVKYLVLTNTWPKFIKDRQSIDSSNLEANN